MSNVMEGGLRYGVQRGVPALGILLLELVQAFDLLVLGFVRFGQVGKLGPAIGRESSPSCKDHRSYR